jgi:hypothetical protein
MTELEHRTVTEAAEGRPSDAGRRRHLSWGADFDTRSIFLTTTIEDDWDDLAKTLWTENRAKIREELRREYGEWRLEDKITNYIAIGTKPFSILAYHNSFYGQVRRSFVMGAYYPALTGTCALGERILNHLILDLRKHYKGNPEYRRVYKKQSFDDWRRAIDTLEAWDVLLPSVLIEFRALQTIRRRSIHFNVGTYSTLRHDSLAAMLHMRKIIEQQFGTHGLQSWFIPGTPGQTFLKKEYESNPFISTYFCAKVSIRRTTLFDRVFSTRNALL